MAGCAHNNASERIGARVSEERGNEINDSMAVESGYHSR
jgi:hypothetical protein